MITESLRQHVLALATALTRDADEAEDVTQVVLLKVHRDLAGFRGDCALSTWLFHITRNVTLAIRRRDARRSALLARARHDACLPAELGVDDTVVARRLDRVVARSLDCLQPRQREVFELTFAGVCIAEIAARLSITPTAVRASLCKARRSLQEGLRRELPAVWAEWMSVMRSPTPATAEAPAWSVEPRRPTSAARLGAQDAA